jgi:hypothetical protein
MRSRLRSGRARLPIAGDENALFGLEQAGLFLIGLSLSDLPFFVPNAA